MSARFEGHEVRRALGLAASAGRVRFDSVSTDTRKLQKGALFIALRGERFDGHEFLARAGPRVVRRARHDASPRRSRSPLPAPLCRTGDWSDRKQR